MPTPLPLPKRERLTLEDLASYDDILTDALVDHVYYWTTIPKNRNRYHASRGIREEDVTSILQKSVIIEKDPAKAQTEFLALPGIRKFVESLKSDKQKDDFQRHLRRYINIYLPDCPFEVSSTNRYTLVTHEAAVMARRRIKKGEVIKYLCGIQVIMTAEEEEEINDRRRDFSIVISSRNKQASLFLGPARFANHDCGANARLITTGVNGMEVVASRNIEAGEEITVTYGTQYFGEDNCECLCKTCEDACRNGWQAPDDGSEIPAVKSIEPAPVTDGPYRFRSRRNFDSVTGSRTPSVTPDVRPVVKKTPNKLRRSMSQASSQSVSPTKATAVTEPSRKRKREPSKLFQEVPQIKIEPSETIGELFQSPANESSTRTSRASSSAYSTPIDSRTTSDTTSVATSIDDEIAATSDKDLLAPIDQLNAGRIIVGPLPSTEDAWGRGDNDDSASVISILSDLPLHLELDEDSMSVQPKKRRKRDHKTENTKSESDHAPKIRTPGDYVLTPQLLAVNESAWISCKLCDTCFVQPDAYITRSSCPRCERHSKLYGYMWPKTDKENKFDEEERVTDHRTVHRFVNPYEEKYIRGRKGYTMSEDRSLTPEVMTTKMKKEKNKPGRKSNKENEKPGKPAAKISKRAVKKARDAGKRVLRSRILE